MMGRFKLEKSAKLWWKDHCKENVINPTETTWDYLQVQLCKNYQTRSYRIDRLNEFLDCFQGGDTLDVFYQRFLKLLRYAPEGMNQDAKVARFISKLNPPLDTRLQSLRLYTFADALESGRPIEQEVMASKDSKAPQPKEIQVREVQNRKREPERLSQRQSEVKAKITASLV